MLFSKARINGTVLGNRIIRSPTYEALADTRGCATARLIDLYKDLARNDVGLILSSCTQIDTKGQHHPTMLSLIHEDSVNSIADMCKEVHRLKTPIGIQLCHSGPMAKSQLTGTDPENPDNMSISDIERVIDNFAKGAKVCWGIGADLVEIHSSGFYLLGSFLSPVSNHRTDEFGGNQKRRNEIVRRILERIRSSVPTSYPVLIKVNQAKNTEDLIETVKMCEHSGADAVELLSWEGRPLNRRRVEQLERLRTVVKIPIIVSGGFLELEEMEQPIKSGLIDFVSLSRPLVRQPNLVKLLKEGKTRKAACIHCNGCLGWTSKKENPLKCIQLD